VFDVKQVFYSREPAVRTTHPQPIDIISTAERRGLPLAHPSRRALARLTVRLIPRASRDEVGDFDAETSTLRVRVTAPPVDGRANEALGRLLARHLGVPRGAVRIVGGATARTKVVEIEGIEAAELAARLSRADRG
jgi:hypothetical protein